MLAAPGPVPHGRREGGWWRIGIGEVPAEVWLPVQRLALLKVWRLVRAGMEPAEVGKRLGVSEDAVRRALKELARYAVRPAEMDADWEGRWVRCYYLSPEELAAYGPVRREAGKEAAGACRRRLRDEELERELAGEEE